MDRVVALFLCIFSYHIFLFYTQAGETFLHVASRAGNLPALEEYAGEFESLEGRDKRGRTPLLVACAFGHEAVATYLLQKGARTDVESQVRTVFLFFYNFLRVSYSSAHFCVFFCSFFVG